MQTVALDGRWEFRCHDAGKWRDATVPGGVYGDLLAADVIDDPYSRDTELDVEWVGETDWEYRRTTTIEEGVLNHERVVLQCDGLDTVATVLVNGEVVGQSANMHRAYEFDVVDALMTGDDNEIQVQFRSPVEYARERAEAYPYASLRSGIRSTNPIGTSSGRPSVSSAGAGDPACQQSASDVPFALWLTPFPRISYVTLHQHHNTDSVTLDIRVGLNVPNTGEYTVAATVTDTDAATSRQCNLDTDGEVELSMTINDPTCSGQQVTATSRFANSE